MILDAAAGNRTMWLHKDAENMVYIDIERKLEVRPTLFADNTNTPFKDKTFDAIFYDPPHNWGGAVHYFSFPSKAERDKVFKGLTGVPTYYGWDKYNTRSGLVKHIYNASIEFRRILKDDGLLWVKWNEMRISLLRVLVVFHEFVELMRLVVNDPTHTAGEHQTYWVCLMKKKDIGAQRPIDVFI